MLHLNIHVIDCTSHSEIGRLEILMMSWCGRDNETIEVDCRASITKMPQAPAERSSRNNVVTSGTSYLNHFEQYGTAHQGAFARDDLEMMELAIWRSQPNFLLALNPLRLSTDTNLA